MVFQYTCRSELGGGIEGLRLSCSFATDSIRSTAHLHSALHDVPVHFDWDGCGGGVKASSAPCRFWSHFSETK